MLEFFWEAALRKGEICKMGDNFRKITVEHWIMTEVGIVPIFRIYGSRSGVLYPSPWQ